MRLKLLSSGRWQVLAPVDDNGTCEVLDALVALYEAKQTKATATGFRALWNQIPHEGPRKLGDLHYHRVDDENQINQFIRRDHRLLCFEANGRLIICSHVLRKKSQKTPAADRIRAAKLRDEYIAAEKANKIVVVSDL